METLAIHDEPFQRKFNKVSKNVDKYFSAYQILSNCNCMSLLMSEKVALDYPLFAVKVSNVMHVARVLKCACELIGLRNKRSFSCTETHYV